MKKLLLINHASQLELNLNWLEFWILKRVFLQRRFSFFDFKRIIKGYKYDGVITDEVVRI